MDLLDINGRNALIAYPTTDMPPYGFPVVIAFHGTFGTGYNWFAPDRLITEMLLHAGYAVIAPSSLKCTSEVGHNILCKMPALRWRLDEQEWNENYDLIFLSHLLAVAIDENPSINGNMIHLMGSSNGGFFAILAASLAPQKFETITICGSGYTSGFNPDIPTNHPRTLILHGSLDVIVPSLLSKLYYDALLKNGITCKRLINQFAGHGWLGYFNNDIINFITKDTIDVINNEHTLEPCI